MVQRQIMALRKIPTLNTAHLHLDFSLGQHTNKQNCLRGGVWGCRGPHLSPRLTRYPHPTRCPQCPHLTRCPQCLHLTRCPHPTQCPHLNVHSVHSSRECNTEEKKARTGDAEEHAGTVTHGLALEDLIQTQCASLEHVLDMVHVLRLQVSHSCI